ncbi:hypothetical protein D3C72_1666550 [compost metagenome]
MATSPSLRISGRLLVVRQHAGKCRSGQARPILRQRRNSYGRWWDFGPRRHGPSRQRACRPIPPIQQEPFSISTRSGFPVGPLPLHFHAQPGAGSPPRARTLCGSSSLAGELAAEKARMRLRCGRYRAGPASGAASICRRGAPGATRSATGWARCTWPTCSACRIGSSPACWDWSSSCCP